MDTHWLYCKIEIWSITVIYETECFSLKQPFFSLLPINAGAAVTHTVSLAIPILKSMKKLIPFNAFCSPPLTYCRASQPPIQYANCWRFTGRLLKYYQILVTLAGVTATGFCLGWFPVHHQSGSPWRTTWWCKTILYSAVGLTIALGAYL